MRFSPFLGKYADFKFFFGEKLNFYFQNGSCSQRSPGRTLLKMNDKLDMPLEALIKKNKPAKRNPQQKPSRDNRIGPLRRNNRQHREIGGAPYSRERLSPAKGGIVKRRGLGGRPKVHTAPRPLPAPTAIQFSVRNDLAVGNAGGRMYSDSTSMSDRFRRGFEGGRRRGGGARPSSNISHHRQ